MFGRLEWFGSSKILFPAGCHPREVQDGMASSGLTYWNRLPACVMHFPRPRAASRHQHPPRGKLSVAVRCCSTLCCALLCLRDYPSQALIKITTQTDTDSSHPAVGRVCPCRFGGKKGPSPFKGRSAREDGNFFAHADAGCACM